MNDCTPLLDRALAAVPPDDTYDAACRSGNVPAFVRGTYYLNGPAGFARGDMRYRHWLDGDGLVCAVRFADEGVRVTHRFVGTEKRLEEEAAGRALYRAFGTAFPGDRLNRGVALQSPANVSVSAFAGAVLAFGEQGLPYELDPVTLETRGAFTFGGTLTDITPFSAHPKRDPDSGELINFGVSFSPSQPMLNVYCFGPDGRQRWRRRLALDLPRSVHDFAITNRHVVFYLSPYLLDAGAIARDGRTVMEALDWRPELGSRIFVLRRDTGEVAASIPHGSCFCLHVINGFENGTDTVLDVIEYERPVYEQYADLPRLFPDVGPGRPVRLIIDTAAGIVRERIPIAYLQAPDFPTTEAAETARPYSTFWMLGISATGRDGSKFFDELARADWSAPDRCDVWRLPAGHFFAGEPAVVSDRSGAHAPVLICPICDPAAGTTSIAIVKAHDFAPIAALDLRHMLPPLFHSTFVADAASR